MDFTKDPGLQGFAVKLICSAACRATPGKGAPVGLRLRPVVAK